MPPREKANIESGAQTNRLENLRLRRGSRTPQHQTHHTPLPHQKMGIQKAG